MTAGQQMLVGTGSNILPASLASGASVGESPIASNATGQIRFNSDGSISYLGGAVEVGGLGPTQWATRISTGIGATIFARATPTAGTFTLNPLSSYTLLGSNQSLTKGPVSTNLSVTFTMDFSYDGVTSALTSPGWMLQTSHV